MGLCKPLSGLTARLRRGTAIAATAALAVVALAAGSASAQTISPAAVAVRIAGLHLVDYFPAASAWDDMWTNYNPGAISADFSRLAAMHANAVRIIPRVGAFGYPQPSLAMLSRLAQTVALAQQHGLRVELTLFDGFSDYSDVAGSKKWASALLAPYAGSSEIVYVDLQNELDRAPVPALLWARELLPYAQSVLHGVPVTASVTLNDGVGNLQRVLAGLGPARPDLYDVHFYGQDGQAYIRLRAVQQAVAPVPVVLGETGYSTTVANRSVPGLMQTQASQEAYQDYYFRSVDYAAESLGIPAAPWILNDFTPGAWPGASAQEFGLYRANGTPKPAVQAESEYFDGKPISTDFNGGFEQVTSVNGRTEPLLWRQYQPSGVTAIFASDSTVAHSGSASARISGTSGGEYGCASFYLVPISALDRSQVYTAQVYARGQGATGATYVSLSWFNANGVYLAQTTSRNLPTGDSSWVALTAASQPPAGAAFVQLHLKSCNNAGTVWFDDAQFGPVPVPAASGSASTGAGRAPATANPSVTVSPAQASPPTRAAQTATTRIATGREKTTLRQEVRKPGVGRAARLHGRRTHVRRTRRIRGRRERPRHPRAGLRHRRR